MDHSPTLNASPMMVAHAAVRAVAPGHLVLYRVGEFYEVLRNDAVVVVIEEGYQGSAYGPPGRNSGILRRQIV
jgi:hypothetical protein